MKEKQPPLLNIVGKYMNRGGGFLMNGLSFFSLVAIGVAAIIGVGALYLLIRIIMALPGAVKAGVTQEMNRQKKIRIEGAELDAKGIMHCPKCNSTQLTANPRGFSAGKAVVGTALFGVIGLAAGAIGNNKIKITCLKCGHEFPVNKK